jgi:hypothetical protein
MMTVLTDLALACPSCATGRAARGLVFGDAFWLHLWAITLPFVVVVLAGRVVLRRLDRLDGLDDAANRRQRDGDSP